MSNNIRYAHRVEAPVERSGATSFSLISVIPFAKYSRINAISFCLIRYFFFFFYAGPTRIKHVHTSNVPRLLSKKKKFY